MFEARLPIFNIGFKECYQVFKDLDFHDILSVNTGEWKVVTLVFSDSPEDSIYRHSSQHQPDLWYKTSSESQVLKSAKCLDEIFFSICTSSSTVGFNDDLRKLICILNYGSNPDLSRNDRWERGDSISIISNLPQTGSLERHRILSESLPPLCYFSADCLCSKSDFQNYNYTLHHCYFQVPPKWIHPFCPMTVVISRGSLVPPLALGALL